MSWRDGRDSCTCSCTLTGLPAQIPTELRRGSANKTQTVILEVPTCLTPHILTISVIKREPPRPLHPFIITYTIILLYILIATLRYVACFPPVLGVLGRYIIYILYIWLTIIIILNYYYYTHTHIRSYIHICDSIIYWSLFTHRIASKTGVHVGMRTCVPMYLHYTSDNIWRWHDAHQRQNTTHLIIVINYVYNFGDAGHLAFLQGPTPQSDNPERLIFLSIFSSFFTYI